MVYTVCILVFFNIIIQTKVKANTGSTEKWFCVLCVADMKGSEREVK